MDNPDNKTPKERIDEVKDSYKKMADESHSIIKAELAKLEGSLISEKEMNGIKLEVLSMIDSITMELASLRSSIMK